MDNEKLFAVKLADNDKKVREKSINQLRSYIRSRSITEKGLKLKNWLFFILVLFILGFFN